MPFPRRKWQRARRLVGFVQFDTADPSLGVQLNGTPGFTVWPATSTGNQFEGSQGGTEYFLSSEAVFQDSGVDDRLRLWTVSNTSSLGGVPALGISARVVNTIPYAVPGLSNQKPGDVPLADCLSDSSLVIAPGIVGCWQLVVAGAGPFPNTEKDVESNDSRMQQVVLPTENSGPRSTPVSSSMGIRVHERESPIL